MKTFVITSNHKLHDHGDLWSFVKADSIDKAKELFCNFNPEFEIIEIEEYIDD